MDKNRCYKRCQKILEDVMSAILRMKKGSSELDTSIVPYHVGKKKTLSYQNKRYHRLRKLQGNHKWNLTVRPCLLCGRDIGSVRVRKNVNKYCSTRCMFLGRRYRKGQKYCYVKIPVTVNKLVRIPIKDLPFILKRGVPKTTGK